MKRPPIIFLLLVQPQTTIFSCFTTLEVVNQLSELRIKSAEIVIQHCTEWHNITLLDQASPLYSWGTRFGVRRARFIIWKFGNNVFLQLVLWIRGSGPARCSFYQSYCIVFCFNSLVTFTNFHLFFFRVGIRTLPDPKDSDFVLTTETVAELSPESPEHVRLKTMRDLAPIVK